MPKALKGKMPRVLKDHRSHAGKVLREGFDALMSQFKLDDPISRRVAVMVEQSWLEYTGISKELNDLVSRPRRGKDQTLALARLRRRRDSVAGRYLGGLRTLTTLAAGNGNRMPPTPTELLAGLQEDRAGD